MECGGRSQAVTDQQLSVATIARRIIAARSIWRRSAVCQRIGNSPAVAAKHYAMSVDLDADFRRAAGMGCVAGQAQQNAQQSAAVSDEQGMTDDRKSPHQTAENPASDKLGQLCVIGDNSNQWAVQDSNL